MTAKNHTLVIDGTYFVYSRLFVLPRQKVPTAFAPPDVDDRFIGTEGEMAILMRKLATDFASELRKVKNLVNRVVFTLDSKSWRKDLFPKAEYKGNREQDSKINWNNVSTVMADFAKLLQDQGVIVNKIKGAEADDLVYAWSTLLNNRGENCIIWSGDTDLMQLVNFNKSTSSYTLWYDNTRSRLAVYPGFNKYLDSDDNTRAVDFDDIFNTDNIFLISNQIKQELKLFINSNALSVSEIHCDDYALSKILTGDKSDNIKSVYNVIKTGKSGKPRNCKISEDKAHAIVETFKKRHGRFSSIYLFEQSYKNEICKIVASVMKVTDHLSLMPALELNTNLILLHTSTIPETLQTMMFDNIEQDITQKNLNMISLLSKEQILNGTKYISSEYKKPERSSNNLF